MTKKVLIRGPLLSQSGYGTHARQIFSYFLTRKDCDVFAQVLSWGITPWCVNSEKEGGIYSEIIDRNKPLEGKFDITVQLQLPHEWDPSLGHYNVGVTAGVETDRCSVDWATTHREKMDMVIVPSSHTRISMLTSGTGKEKKPIHVVPESYFPELLAEPKDQPFQFSTSKNFLTVGVFTADNPETDRKNVANTIKWFLQEFDGDKDVGLVVKASMGRETTIDRTLVRKTLQNVVKSSGCKSPPQIHMLHGVLSREEMNCLYRHPSLMGFVSATRGEGFGLPMLESAVAGLPVVCTNWSSVTEFLHGDSFLGVDYDISVVPEKKVDGQIFIKGAKWSNPRESNFKRKLRKLHDNRDKYAKAANELSVTLTKTHSQLAINAKYDSVFAGVV